MDYFSVIILIIVVFIFATDRKIKSLNSIVEQDSEIFVKLEKVKKNLKTINFKSNNMNYDKIKKTVNKIDSEYVLIKNIGIKLSEEDISILLANYLSYNERPSGFNLLYSYDGKKISLKRIYVDIINYLNIFNKQKLSTYAVVLCRKIDFENNEKQFKQNLVSYVPSEITNIHINNEQMQSDRLKKIYIDKLSNSNISIILKLLLLIISGSFITSNLIYSLFNIGNDITGLMISFVIYCCYSYIIRYVYSPIGKQRIVASYIFPIYFVSYIVISIYTLFSKVIKKVHAS